MERTLDFIKRAKIIHGDRYDYSTTVYKKMQDKLEIICKKHGKFVVTPNNHLSNHSGCPQCSIANQQQTVRDKHRQIFVSECSNIHYNYYDYSNTVYTNAHAKIQIICPTHGEFSMVAYTHKQGGKCPKCAKTIASSKITLSTEEFADRSTLKHNGKYDYSYVEYTNANTKVQIICPIHGPFLQRPNQHMRGEGCPTCGLDVWWKEQGGYSLSYFTRNPSERKTPAILYLIKFDKPGEQFYKIGITKRTIKERYHWGYKDYNMTIIHETPTSLLKAYEAEQNLLSLFNSQKYVPTIKIGGWTECVSIHINVSDIIRAMNDSVIQK